MRDDRYYQDLTAAHAIARRLARMTKADDVDTFGPRILKLMAGVPFGVFKILDEQPGLFGYMDGRFYMLRQVRNHAAYGRTLFDGLAR